MLEVHRLSLQTKSRDSTTTHPKPSVLSECPRSIIRTIQFYTAFRRDNYSDIYIPGLTRITLRYSKKERNILIRPKATME